MPPFLKLRIRLAFILSQAPITVIGERFKIDHSTVSRQTSGKGIVRGNFDGQRQVLWELWQREAGKHFPLTFAEFDVLLFAITTALSQDKQLTAHIPG